jgi:Asp-tRNA(Asn)/Glu-tRNA(Gln) amidotransferase A subunit family amidase
MVDTPFRWEPDRPLASLRVGIDQAAFDSIAKDAARAPIYNEVIETIKRFGVTLRPVILPPRTDAYEAIAETVINCEGAASFAHLNQSGGLAQLAQQGDNNWPNIFRVGSMIPAADYIHALRLRTRLQEEMDAALGDLDCYITIPFSGPTLLYTNLTGHPTLVTRCGSRGGLPQSIEFVGGLYKEAEILRLGLAFEKATKWHTQWPDMATVL